MSKEFNDYLNNCIKSFNKFKILKKNKNKTIYTLSEGMGMFQMKFIVNIKELSCTMCSKSVKECSLKKCKHIYYIFLHEYNISKHNLQFLWINDNYLKVIDKKEMIFEDEDINCPICLDDSTSHNIDFNKIIHCLDCGKFYHTKCLKAACKDKKEIKCLICTNNWKPDWMKIL